MISPTLKCGTLVEHNDRVMSVMLTEIIGGTEFVLCGWNIDTEYGIKFRCRAFNIRDLRVIENQAYDG